MSSGAGDLQLLRAELLDLRAEVLRLQARVTALESGRFEFVEVSSEAGSSQRPLTQPASGSGSPATLTREEVCRRVGEFLRRSLDGGHRGTSCRDQLPLASRFWIVVRGINGEVYEPPRVFSRFGSCKHLVKRGSEVGDSVFVGLPAHKDVLECLRAGGFGEPRAIEG